MADEENRHERGNDRSNSDRPRRRSGSDRNDRPNRSGNQRSRGDGDFKPRRDGDSRPRRDGDSRSRRDGDRRPQRDGDYRPRRDGDFKPRRDGDSRPRRDGDSRPQRDGDYRPRRDGDSRPRRDGDFKPRRDGDSRPRRDGDSRPRRDGDFKPRRDNDRRPQRDGDYRPRRDGDFKPRRDGDFRPRRDGDSRPQREGDYRPRRDGDSRPRRDGDFKPRRDGDSRPRRDGDRRPQREGDYRPRRDGDFKPRRDGDSRPRRDGDRRPQRDGDSRPRRDSDSGDQKRFHQDRGGREREFDGPDLRPVREAFRAPDVPDDCDPEELDMVARIQLKTLEKDNADRVARHLAMTARLIDDDPELAHQHAIAASRTGGRIGVVRETLGITAYTLGDFALALRELRTFRRLTGSDDQAPLMIDCERGLERPEKGLEFARTIDASKLEPAVRVEFAIAKSGARLDLGQKQAALEELRIPELNRDKAFDYSPALFAAYANVLEELGRDDEAAEWFGLSDRAVDALHGAYLEAGVESVAIEEEFIRVPREDFDESDASAPDTLDEAADDVAAEADDVSADATVEAAPPETDETFELQAPDAPDEEVALFDFEEDR